MALGGFWPTLLPGYWSHLSGVLDVGFALSYHVNLLDVGPLALKRSHLSLPVSNSQGTCGTNYLAQYIHVMLGFVWR